MNWDERYASDRIDPLATESGPFGTLGDKNGSPIFDDRGRRSFVQEHTLLKPFRLGNSTITHIQTVFEPDGFFKVGLSCEDGQPALGSHFLEPLHQSLRNGKFRQTAHMYTQDSKEGHQLLLEDVKNFFRGL